MGTKIMVKFSLSLLCILFCAGSFAHHSTSHYSRDISEMEGTLVDIHWRNPHVYLFLETEDEASEQTVWELEAGTLYNIERTGISSDLFNIGDQIRVAGNKSDKYPNQFWLENVLASNGQEYIFVARSTPRWNDIATGGRQDWNNTATGNKKTSDVGEGIFRVWSPSAAGTELSPGLNANRISDVATEEALAGKANWDYTFDQTCQVPGMPRANHSPHPHQFIDMDDTIHIYSEEFHQTRIIHMNAEGDPETQPYSLLGYSTGKWENERELVIETTRIDFPFMDLTGIKQSREVSVKETYVLSEDESRVEYTVIINDPVMLKEAYIKRGVWLDLNEVIDKETRCIPREVATEI